MVLSTAPFNPRPIDLKNIAAMMAAHVHKPWNTMSPPCFLDARGFIGVDPRDLISVENGLLNIRTRTLYDCTPKFFTRTAIPVRYDPDAPKPERWLAFLSEVMNKRQPLVDLLQEAFGYTLSSDTHHQKIFDLWGKPRSGKGTVMRILEALCGPLNCHNPSIETLAGRFGYQGCIAKSVIMITDMDTDNKPDLARAASKINAISGEDAVTVERKGVTDWNGHLPGRLWLANNALPNFGTHAAATAFRALVLPFEVSFAGRENPNLTAELKGELAGILNWSLDGHDRLAARGHFVEPAECAAAKVRMLHVSDPIHGFGEEWCRFHPRAAVDKDALFDGYQDFCRTCGVRPMPKHTFAERFLQVFPETASARPRRGDKRPYVFSGVRFNDDQMIARYRHDPELVSFFGAKSPTTLERDANRWPIPLNASGKF